MRKEKLETDFFSFGVKRGSVYRGKREVICRRRGNTQIVGFVVEPSVPQSPHPSQTMSPRVLAQVAL